MIKIIDADKLFDEYISDYVYKNIGKIKPEEIEDKMPVMYEQFGNAPLKEFGGKTPNEYYRAFSADELLNCLKTHLNENVPVSDFLVEALRDKGEKEIARELNNDNSEEFSLYLMNMLLEIKSPLAADKCLDFILYDYSESMRELAAEMLYDFADLVSARAVDNYETASPEVKECLLDVLSHAKKNDKIYNILISEFSDNPDKVALYSGFIARYGDERALPLLFEAIENEKITYADFEELRFAIEALGGVYDKERDFSFDKTHKIIKGGKTPTIV